MADLVKIGALQQFLVLQREVDQLIQERQAWVELAGRISPCRWDGEESGARIRVAVQQLSEVSRELTFDISRLVALQSQVKQAISGVADARCREILVRRYLQGQTWEQIAGDMAYSRMQISRLHDRAVGEVPVQNLAL